MAGVMGQEADGMEPDGTGARRARWPGGRDGRVHDCQMAVAGVVGVAWVEVQDGGQAGARSGGKGQLEAR